MKKIVFMAVLFVIVAQCVSCNDDGVGREKHYEKKRDRRPLIQNESKPLKTQYAALGIGAWALVSAVGLFGNRYVNRKK